MSKKSRAPKANNTKSVQRDEGIGPFKIVATVFGEYQYGKLVGKVNPKVFTRMTVYGDTFKKAIAKLNATEAFYRLEEVVDEGKEAIKLQAISVPKISPPEGVNPYNDEIEEVPFVPGLDELVKDFVSLEGLRN